MDQRAFSIPIPPSVNRTYRAGRSKTGKTVFFKDKKVADKQNRILGELVALKIKPLPAGSYSLSFVCHGLRKNADIDNICKAGLDIIAKAGIIPNDKHVNQLFVQRAGPAKPPRMDVVITLIENN